MYISATTTRDPSGAHHCVGVATASSVHGPYTGQVNSLICPLSQGGAIDASGYADDNGQRYLSWKVDGNSIGHGGNCGNTVAPIAPTPLMVQAVAADGFTLQGAAIQLLDNSGASDDGIVEAPDLTKIGDTYFLFFSSGCYTSPDYTISYATSTSVVGPYTRQPTPLFQTGDYGLVAPGGASVWPHSPYMAFHANYVNVRAMYVAQISYSVGQLFEGGA